MNEVKQIVARTGSYFGMGRWRGRRFRVKARGQAAYYHVMSRTCGGAVFFNETEKEAFRRLLWRMGAFLGVEICTYCVMGNHFHVLVRVPNKQEWLQRFTGPEGEKALLAHLRTFYSDQYVEELEVELEMLRGQGRMEEAERLLDRYRGRFCELSLFCKEVKERFSRWYNRRHERHGTLWSERFRSVLVEEGVALSVMAAYIDLNPVRAGLVEDPGQYGFSGYGEAMGAGEEVAEAKKGGVGAWGDEEERKAGQERARAGLCRLMGCGLEQWEGKVKWEYLGWLGESGREVRNQSGEVVRRGFDVKAVREKLEKKEKLKLGEMVLSRVRQFSAGLAVGSKGFVEEVFEAHREYFGPRRKDGARGLSSCAEKSLASLRDS